MGDASDTRGRYDEAHTAVQKDPRATVDRAFAVADRFLGGVAQILGVDPPAAREHVRKETGVVLSRWHIHEVIDADRGAPMWIVTDGIERAECSSPELADRVLGALNAGARHGAR